MRIPGLIVAALLMAGAAQAQTATPSAACLAPMTPQDGPVAIRDVKFVVYEAAMPGSGANTRQSVVAMQACAALSGTATTYALTYRPVLFSADGHLLQGGTLVSNLKVPADDAAKGGPAHALITETFSVGYIIDRARLGKTMMFTALAAGPCTAQANGSCAPLPSDVQARTITVPACIADGTAPTPAECPAAPR